VRICLHSLLFIIVAMTLWQCSQDKDRPDISDIQVEVDIRRFEQDLFALDTNAREISFAAQVEGLRQEYPTFFEVFTEKILGAPYIANNTSNGRLEKVLTRNDASIPENNMADYIEGLIKHPGFQKLYDTTTTIYNDISAVEEDLTQAFRYYKYYFPDRPVPEVVSYISEFALGTFTYEDSLLGIGWDFYMGDQFQYDYTIFPEYVQRTMNRQHLVSKAIEAVASGLVGSPEGNRMLDFMINNGKMLYLKSHLLPEMPDSIIMKYTPAQMQWVEENELELWAYFLRKDLLYSTRQADFQKLINPSPMGNTDMPREAPGRTANWVGWQIVQRYMEQFPDTSMEELIALDDAQELLKQSKYKPRRR